MQRAKTMFFMSALMVLFVSFGAYIGGSSGMIIAFLFALGLNFFAYFYSDKLVLKHYNANPINSNHPLYKSLETLCEKANLPLPRLYLINDSTPNAFATGRNPQNAVVALTSGLLDSLNEDEIKAVIAHELGHIKHYDILSASIAAVFAGAIAMLANFSYMGTNRRNGNAFLGIALAFIMPMAAMIIQMSISRSREYEADKFSASLTNPQHLITSLTKLENYSHRKVLNNANEQSAHMFIINPLSGISNIDNLFRTHPTTEQRIERLQSMKPGLDAYFKG